MINKPIAMNLTKGPHNRFSAEVSVEQFKAIEREFAQSRDNKQWSDYLAFTRGERGNVVAAPFVEPFEPMLLEIIGKHTPYPVAFFWRVLDELVAADTPTP